MNLKPLMGIGLALLAGFGPGARSARAEWYENLKLSGDLRFRLEEIQDESQVGVGKSWYRDRDRVRVRLGVAAQVDDYWKAEVRLATSEAGFAGGNGDPVSVNQTLGDVETKKPIWLDLAYVEYKVLFNNLKVTAGKMPMPWEAVGKNKFMWKDDLTPEGVGGKFTLELLPNTSLFVQGGSFWLREVAAGYDPMLYAAQVGVKSKPLDDLRITAGVGEFYATDLTRQFPLDYKTAAPNTYTASAGGGNTLTQSNQYLNNYYVFEGFCSVETSVLDLPVNVYADYALNNGANEFKKGYVVGLILNKASKEGSWEFGYNWRLLEKDCFLGAFSDSDFAGGGTDASGHYLTASYMITDAVRANVNFFRDAKKLSASSQTFYNRAQVEVVLAY